MAALLKFSSIEEVDEGVGATKNVLGVNVRENMLEGVTTFFY